jgi:hypothetical protein
MPYHRFHIAAPRRVPQMGTLSEKLLQRRNRGLGAQEAALAQRTRRPGVYVNDHGHIARCARRSQQASG